MNESFRVGRALGLSFTIWIKNFIPFLFLAVLLSVPEILYVYSKIGWSGPVPLFERGDVFDFLIFALLFVTIGFGCSMLVVSTFAYGVVMELKGQHAGIGATVSKGFSRFFPVLGVVILLFLIFGVVLIAASFVLGRLGFVGQIAIWCIVGVIYSAYFVAVPAAVIERPGAGGALTRSRELTMGRRGHIFGMLALVYGVKVLVSLILDDSITTADNVEEAIRRIFYIRLGLDIFLSMLLAVMASVSYYLLRNEKEGTSADELASVFE